MENIYFAGGCLWGVQEYLRYLPGVLSTEAGRANGSSPLLSGGYDGYAECVKTTFDTNLVSVEELMSYFFEIIDPYSINKQGDDIGEKYRTGVYSTCPVHLKKARGFIDKREDSKDIALEVLPLVQYVKSAEEHQNRLLKYPSDHCHIPREVLYKYRYAY